MSEENGRRSLAGSLQLSHQDITNRFTNKMNDFLFCKVCTLYQGRVSCS